MDTRTKLLEARAVKGNQFAQVEGAVRRVSDSEYQVRSQRTGEWYQVYATEKGLNCSCPDFQFRGGMPTLYAKYTLDRGRSMMEKLNISITNEMLRRLEEERKKRALDSVPETIRVLLSEALRKQ